MLVHGGERRQPEVFSYLGERRRVAMFADKMLQVIDHLLLSPRERRHLHKPPAFSRFWRKSGENASRLFRATSMPHILKVTVDSPRRGEIYTCTAIATETDGEN